TFVAALSPAARVAWTVAGALLAAAVLLLLARRRFAAAVALGWWLLAIAPTAAIAALDYPWPGLARWLYVGLPGPLILLYLASRALSTGIRLALATVVAALWLVGAERALTAWHDDEALYTAMVTETPTDAWAWRALGTVRLAAGRYSDAADCFHRAVT